MAANTVVRLAGRVIPVTFRVEGGSTLGASNGRERSFVLPRMGEINWLTELRKIEREFDGLPPEPTPTERRARRAAEQHAEKLRKERATLLGVLARFLPVVGLAGAIMLWPYHRGCGTGLFVYLGAEGVIVVGGLWLVACTWRARMAKTHGVALILVLWGLMLIGHQILPRVGYAKTDAAHPARWWCKRGKT